MEVAVGDGGDGEIEGAGGAFEGGELSCEGFHCALGEKSCAQRVAFRSQGCSCESQRCGVWGWGVTCHTQRGCGRGSGLVEIVTCRVSVLAFRVSGFEIRVSGLGLRVSSFGGFGGFVGVSRVTIFFGSFGSTGGFKNSGGFGELMVRGGGFGFQVSGFGFQVSGFGVRLLPKEIVHSVESEGFVGSDIRAIRGRICPTFVRRVNCVRRVDF